MGGPSADGEKPPNLGSGHVDSQGAVISEIDVASQTLEFHERPLVYDANRISATQRYNRNVARSIYNAGAVLLDSNPELGIRNFTLIAYDAKLSGQGNEWQEAVAQHFGDELLVYSVIDVDGLSSTSP